MGRRDLDIPISLLKGLYTDRGLTAMEIAKKLDCTDVTILNHLRKNNIPTRTAGRKRFKYKKSPFNGNGIEKSYLLGFRIGDLNVYKPFPNSRILVVRCHTTLLDQVNLIKSLFTKYGHVTISYSKKNSYNINCFLDNSFQFLIEKKVVPDWINENISFGWSFMAGYIDAEANFGLNQGRGRFKVDSYDYHVLYWMSNFLNDIGIRNKFRCIYKKGERLSKVQILSSDLWRININFADDLERFIEKILPYMLHSKRVKNAKIVLNNVIKRRWIRQQKNLK